MAYSPGADPYQLCERQCRHELGQGMLIAELLGSDGPHPAGYMAVIITPTHRPEPLGATARR